MSVKCIVIGDINGQFNDVFKKVASLHAKNNFTLAIVVGSLFAASDAQEQGEKNGSTSDTEEHLDALLNGRVVVPLPTYFCLGKTPLPGSVIQKLSTNNNELCENLFFLGKRTTIKTSEGIRIVALGGALDPELVVDSSKDQYTPFHSIGDATSLRGANNADLLITSDWPKNIRTGSKSVPTDLTDIEEQATVADLCSALKPRYHFSTSNFFYEREPFFHQSAEDSSANTTYSITRFLSLAPFGNPNKQKWIYAFTIDPSAAPPVVLSPGTSASPLSLSSASTKKRGPQSSQQESFSRYATDPSHNHHRNDRHRHKKRRHHEPAKQPPGPEECFFCLANPNLATHLVTSIGSEAYMTTAKGPLTSTTTFADLTNKTLNIPAHMLITPLSHAATLSDIPEPAVRLSTQREMRKFRNAFHSMLSSAPISSATETGEQVKLGAVTWEVSRANGIHIHWQILPVPTDLINKGLVEAAFKVEVENEKWPPFEPAQIVSDEIGLDEVSSNDTNGAKEGEGEDEGWEIERDDHFSVWIWNPDGMSSDGSGKGKGREDGRGSGNSRGTSKRLTLRLDHEEFRFDLQFGRRVLAKLLGLEKRANWRDCAQSEGEESADAEGWKRLFKEFDFTLDE